MFKQGGRVLRAWTRGQDICRTLHHRRVSVTKPGLDCVQAEIRNGLDIPIVVWILPESDSSALLVMKSHQQKAWKTFTRFGSDFLRCDQSCARPARVTLAPC